MSGEIITRMYDRDWSLLAEGVHRTTAEATRWIRDHAVVDTFLSLDSHGQRLMYHVPEDGVVEDYRGIITKATTWPLPHLGGDREA